MSSLFLLFEFVFYPLSIFVDVWLKTIPCMSGGNRICPLAAIEILKEYVLFRTIFRFPQNKIPVSAISPMAMLSNWLSN